MSPSPIRTSELHRDFGGRTALDGVSINVESGQVLALAGPNGAGKTTLLKILAGLIQPSSGSATLFDQPSFPPSSTLVSQIRCVLDPLQPPGGARVREVIDLSASASPQFDTARAITLCNEREIETHRRWKQLSKGQKRWVMAVLAIVSKPSVLLLDEPADGLDPSARQQLYGLLRGEANTHGTAVIIASHVLGDIERIADEIAILDRGSIRLHAGLDDLREQIREVEINGDAFPIDSLPADAKLLGSRTVEPVTIGWVRFADPSDTARLLPGEIRRRSVPLEPVYLAITDHAWRPDTNQHDTNQHGEPAHA